MYIKDIIYHESRTCLIMFIGMWEQLRWALQLTRRCAFRCWLKRLGADLLSELDHIAIEATWGRRVFVFLRLRRESGTCLLQRSLQFMSCNSWSCELWTWLVNYLYFTSPHYGPHCKRNCIMDQIMEYGNYGIMEWIIENREWRWFWDDCRIAEVWIRLN